MAESDSLSSRRMADLTGPPRWTRFSRRLGHSTARARVAGSSTCVKTRAAICGRCSLVSAPARRRGGRVHDRESAGCGLALSRWPQLERREHAARRAIGLEQRCAAPRDKRQCSGGASRRATNGEFRRDVVARVLGTRDVRSFGDSTAGRNSLNTSVPLSDGATLIVTSAYPRDRLGRSYPLTVAPDELVLSNPSAGDDAVLRSAVAWLRRQSACASHR